MRSKISDHELPGRGDIIEALDSQPQWICGRFAPIATQRSTRRRYANPSTGLTRRPRQHAYFHAGMMGFPCPARRNSGKPVSIRLPFLRRRASQRLLEAEVQIPQGDFIVEHRPNPKPLWVARKARAATPPVPLPAGGR